MEVQLGVERHSVPRLSVGGYSFRHWTCYGFTTWKRWGFFLSKELEERAKSVLRCVSAPAVSLL